MSYEQVIFELKEDIAIIRMNRPEKKNAFSQAMNREILEIMTHIENTSPIRGVLLTGVGESFSAGLDLDISFLQTMEKK